MRHKASLLLFLPGFCYGAAITVSNETFLGKTLQTFAMLGIVILLILSLGYFVRKLSTGRTRIGHVIKMSNILPLGARERIALIEVKNVTLLVGITATQISTLHVFSTTDGKQNAS